MPGPNYDDMVVGPKGPIKVKYKRKNKKKSSADETPVASSSSSSSPDLPPVEAKASS